MVDRNDASLVDMLVAGRLIQQFIAGQEFADFAADSKTQSAVILQILILGEAAKRLSKGFCADHPEIAWADMMRMRDKMIHHYESLDAGEVWKTAKRDVPHLLSILEPMVGQEKP